MAALARAGSVVALLVLLVLALVPTWTGPGAGPVLAPGPPAVQAASANPGVAPADALSAHVSADRSAADAGQSITFACSASGGTPPYVYAWTLSDGGIGTGPTITHSFGSPGTYDATCTVTDVLLGIASASKSVVISPLPSVVASVDHDLAAPGTVLKFSASPSGGDGSFSYQWTFGDDSSGSGAPATHAYTAAGSYQATVTASDGNGGTASSSTSVTISDIGVTANVSPTSGDATTVFTFTASASRRGPVGLVHMFGHGRSRAVCVRLDLWRWQYRERTGREPRVPIGGSDDRDVHGNRFFVCLRRGVEVGRREPVSIGRRVRKSLGRSAGHIPHVLRPGHRRPGWLHGLRVVPRGRSNGLWHPSRTRVRATGIVSGERRRHRRERRNGIGLRVGHHLEPPGDGFRNARIGKHGYLVRIQRNGDGWRRRPVLLFVGLRGWPGRRWSRGLPPVSEPRQLRAVRSRDRFVEGGPDGRAVTDRGLLAERPSAAAAERDDVDVDVPSPGQRVRLPLRDRSRRSRRFHLRPGPTRRGAPPGLPRGPPPGSPRGLPP